LFHEQKFSEKETSRQGECEGERKVECHYEPRHSGSQGPCSIGGGCAQARSNAAIGT
jgi:hypothetical protein